MSSKIEDGLVNVEVKGPWRAWRTDDHICIIDAVRGVFAERDQ